MPLTEELRSDLIKERLPLLVDLGDELRRGRWLVRFEHPTVQSAELLGTELQSWAASEISRLYLADYDEEKVARACPRVKAYQLDELRYLLEIDFASIGREVGHSFLVSMHGVLHELNKRHRIDEIQGLPARFWHFLEPDFRVGPPE